MRPSKFSEAEIAQAINRVKAGTPATEICRALGITQTTFYRWRDKYERGTMSEMRELRAVREENQRLKQLVADLLLDKQEVSTRGKR